MRSFLFRVRNLEPEMLCTLPSRAQMVSQAGSSTPELDHGVCSCFVSMPFPFCSQRVCSVVIGAYDQSPVADTRVYLPFACVWAPFPWCCAAPGGLLSNVLIKYSTLFPIFLLPLSGNPLRLLRVSPPPCALWRRGCARAGTRPRFWAWGCAQQAAVRNVHWVFSMNILLSGCIAYCAITSVFVPLLFSNALITMSYREWYKCYGLP